MSIEITGPKKYKFQDRVCALLAILHAEDLGASLEIEPKDGEDAQLTLNSGGQQRVIEIQIKGEKPGVNPIKLADWLAHFPSRQEKNPLIERLINDQNRTAVIIATGRCDDETSSYVADFSESMPNHQSGAVTLAQAATSQAAFVAYANLTPAGEKPIKKKHRAYIATMFSPKRTDLREALHRLLIFERIGDKEVKQLTVDALTSLHQTVPDQIEGLLTKIEEIVSNSKRGGNILPQVRAVILDARAQDPLTSGEYLERGDESSLKERLAKEKVLLIAGEPRIGKSTIARRLAVELAKKGFRTKFINDMEAVQRFLIDPVREPRAVFVDDPFGGAHVEGNAVQNLARLDALIPTLANDRRLIVAQAQDRLLEVSRHTSVASIRTGGALWVNLTALNGTFLARIWAQACQKYRVPGTLAAQVQNALTAGKLVLEPGCLVHLAVEHDKLPVGADLQGIARLAREDARALGNALRVEGLGELASALAVTTTPDFPVTSAELAFALGGGGPERPGESRMTGRLVSGGRVTERRVATRHSYSPPPVLTQANEAGLEALEIRHIIDVLPGNFYTFTHPFYRASSESLLDAATGKSEERAIRLVNRGLFSLAPQTANASARNLSWIYKNLDTKSGREAVMRTATDGLKSIFPAVRDTCYSFLVKNLEELPTKDQGKISDWVYAVTNLDANMVEWIEGEPRIPAVGDVGILEVDLFPKEVKLADVRHILQILESDKAASISPELAARACSYYESNPERLGQQAIGRLLSYDVALIRAPAAGAWLQHPRENDELILSRIFGEEHPAIARSCLQAVVDVWWLCKPFRQEQLKRGLLRMISSPLTAAALIDRFVLFDRVEETGQNPPWELFQTLMPKVLNILPPGATLNDARLYNVLDKAIPHISLEALMQIVDDWIALVQSIAEHSLPSDYLLGVTDILIKGTKDQSTARGDRVRVLLSISGTGARIRVVADLVDAWDALTSEEQSILVDQLNSTAQDSVWLRGTVLARRSTPAILDQLLLPPGVNLLQDPASIIQQMPVDLLNAALHVYTGFHPVIYYVAVHGSRVKVWEPIVWVVAKTPAHPMFDVAWGYLMSDDNAVQLAELIRHHGKLPLPRLFDLMITRKLGVTGEFMPEVWRALFDVEQDGAVKANWIAQMANGAPIALDDLSEAAHWLPKEHLDAFYDHFKPDLNLFILLSNISAVLAPRELDDEDRELSNINESVVELFRRLLEKDPPQHWATYGGVRDRLRSLGIQDESFFAELEASRRQALTSRREKPASPTPMLDSWVVG